MALQAKLVHGNIYTLNGGRGGDSKVFKKGQWTTVTAQERDYLEENALERQVVQQSNGPKTTMFVPKFDFREGKESTDTGEDPGAKPATRTRTRKS